MALGGLATAAVIFAVADGTFGNRFLFPGAEGAPAPVAVADQAPPASAVPPPQVNIPRSAPLTAPPEHPIAKQAFQWGISACLGGITDIANFLTGNADASWRLVRGITDSDKEAFAGMIVARDKTNGLQGVSTMFAAPVTLGRCNSGYDLVIYFPEACEQTRARKQAGFDTKVELGPVAEVWTTADGHGSITLMPAGIAGCVMIRTGLLY